jgi:hypothetical protein
LKSSFSCCRELQPWSQINLSPATSADFASFFRKLALIVSQEMRTSDKTGTFRHFGIVFPRRLAASRRDTRGFTPQEYRLVGCATAGTGGKRVPSGHRRETASDPEVRSETSRQTAVQPAKIERPEAADDYPVLQG